MTAYHDVNKRAAAEAEPAAAVPRGHRDVGRLRGRGRSTRSTGRSSSTIWLEHLLVLSMLQHPSGTWRWGRFVVVHPAGNTDFADACSRYRALLVDQSTFASVTVEELLDAGVLPAAAASALRDRYLPNS